LSATLAVWLAAAGVEFVGTGHPASDGRHALMALRGYLAYGWPLALVASVVGGLPLYAWLRRSGRLDRRTLVVGATVIGTLTFPAIGAIARGEGVWGQPPLYVWGGLAGLVAGAVFARLMRVGAQSVT
jgi:hypothetical protein